MTPDSFADALQHLDPGSRALLDLSLRRGMDDAEIAELLGADSDYVSSSRDAAIAQLAGDLGMHGDSEAVREALEDMPEDAWRPTDSGASASANGEYAEVPLAVESASVEPAPRPRVKPRSGRSRLVLSGLLLAGAILALVLALTGGGGGGKSKTSSAPTGKPAPGTTSAAGKSAPLASLGARGKGTAALDGRKLTLTVSGLSQPVGGSYEVWLYNDEIDARAVATFRSSAATVKAELPKSTAGYRYLDVSLEPSDGNPNHSGQSVLRVPLGALR
jgi:Anti-sigma-K factor rskA